MKAIRQKIKTATATPKGRIIFFSVLLLVVAAVAGGFLFWSFYKKRIIRLELEKAIRDKSEGLYSVKYDEMKLDEVAGFLSVTNLRLTYDSMKYVNLLSRSDAPPTLLRINIPKIIVSGVKTPQALIDKEIAGRTVEIQSPSIDIVYTNAGKDSARRAPTKEVYEQILGNLNMISMDTVLITNATIRTLDLKSGDVKVELANTFVRLVDVKVDSVGEADNTRLLFSKQIAINSGKLSWSSPDKRYDYFMDSIDLNSVTKEISVKRFKIDPRLDEASFTKTLRVADDRFDFTLNRISIHQLDFPKLLNEELFADTVIVQAGRFMIYRDLAKPHDGKNRVGTYPNQAIADLPLPLSIKVILLQNCFVEYKERNVKTRQSGKVQFYQTNATLTNVTNIRELADKNNIMVVDARTRFLNLTPLKATWKFYLFHPKGRFDLEGSLGSIDARKLNVITLPMGPAEMEGGKINSLYFNFSGNDYGLNGQVKMLYDKLKVAILSTDEDTKELKKRKLASLAANIIMKNSNPSGRKDEARVVEVNFERDTKRSMFHMIWKTLFKGVKETAGINR